MCGEHSLPCARVELGRGSSPRVRGTPSHQPPPRRNSGIIPACAGNTATVDKTVTGTRDHPRVCGEHHSSGVSASSREGSSPRVRGTHSYDSCPYHRSGIIPACAGNTCLRRRLSANYRDHPRVCGEHLRSAWHIAVAKGSSPRVRGTLGVRGSGCRGRGIIPACAGNTCLRPTHRSNLRDHPRVCGEHS